MACTAAMRWKTGLQTLLDGSGLQLKSLGNQAWTLEPAPANTESTLTVVGDWLGDARENDVLNMLAPAMLSAATISPKPAPPPCAKS